MLRATTESMSAIIGGTDSLSVTPFDNIFIANNDFSNRIARNIQIILSEEAYFDRVIDPAAGSYYIENLTNSIAAEAWKLFLKVEKEGGYIACLKKGLIQSEIKTISDKRINDIASRRETLVGTNQYPNFNEQVLGNIEKDVFEDKNEVPTNQVVKPIKSLRGAQAFEKLRLTTEKSGKRPKVFMLTIGSLAMRLARSQFSSNFFALAGFEVIDNNGFDSIEEGVRSALEVKADIVVLCSSDDEYATLAPEAYEKIGSKAIFVVAGAPASMEELVTKGIVNFINIKSNVLEALTF
jgi:methylmalonyl-CoA mutase